MDLNMKVLIVDDAPKIRWILKYILKRNGFTNVTEAHNGKSALEVLKNKKIDLIFSDWNMPVMSGLELLNKVRSDDELKNVPFIMITAEFQKDNIANAVKAGITDYVMKPFTAKAISEKLQKVFG